MKKEESNGGLLRYLQCHILTVLPPSNPNRDDNGEPKTVIYGGALRGRLSQQSQANSIYASENFLNEIPKSKRSERTREFGSIVFDKLVSQNVDRITAFKVTMSIAREYVKEKLKTTKKRGAKKNSDIKERYGLTDDDLKKIFGSNAITFPSPEEPIVIMPEEMENINDIIADVIKTGNIPSDTVLKTIRTKTTSAPDIVVLTGRSAIPFPEKTIKAAVNMSHAISIGGVEVDDDYFSVVDTIKMDNEADDSGSSHLNETHMIGGGIFYHYMCVNRLQLLKNLEHREDAVEYMEMCIAALIKTAFTNIIPQGNIHKFAQYVRPFYMRCEKGDYHPSSLHEAFHEPVNGYRRDAIEQIEKFNAMKHGKYERYAECMILNEEDEKSADLKKIIEFAKS